MSLYHFDDGGATNNNLAATAAEISMLEQNQGLMNSLDMDMSLPMDLDVDLSLAVAANAASFGALSGQAAASIESQAQDQMTSGPPGPGSSGGYSSNPTPTPVSTQQQQDLPMTGAGAGPLPTGFGMAPHNSSSTLTEFTKRRNWSQRIIEELKDFLHILTPDGRILYVSPSCKAITGYEPQDIVGKFIGELVHPDDSGIFMREFNESIASGNSLRFFYRFKKDDGSYMIFECHGHPHMSSESPSAQLAYAGNSQNQLAVAGLCRGFFMMARPYPTKNAALLDSFLEHKIENERLMKRIEELKREEAEENAEQDRLYRDHVISQTGATPSESHFGTSQTPDVPSDAPAVTPNYQGMPPPAKPTISNTALTRQNLDSAFSAQKPDSIAEKMSRYEASSNHLESIELLTGLRYRDGERSHGISTGDTSPALIRGDAGIAILLDRDREGSKKEKKKLKVADEYVCADCGTLDSPEWRKGPRGPKTLCNACGLRWAKKEKKRSGDDGKMDSPEHISGSSAQAGLSRQASGGMAGPMRGMQTSPHGSSRSPGLLAKTSSGSS